MLDKNEMVRNTIRMFLAEVQRHEIDNKEEVDDSKAIQIINKMIKQRNDSISQFKSGGRNDLAEKEESEILILQDFLPEQMSEEDINKLVIEAINETEAKEPQDIGKVMGFLKTKIQGNADMGIVSKLVKENLQG